MNIEPVFDDDDVGGGVVSTTSFHGLAFRKRFEITVKPPRVAVEQLHTSDLTDKVRTVLRHLQRGTASHTHDSFRAMVFVERRLSAKVLAELVNLCSNQMFPHVTSSFITGMWENSVVDT